MGNRLSKIYTRTGDDGTTGMADGSRASKADLVFEVMGDVDELNAHIGMIVAHLNTATVQIKSNKDNIAALKHALSVIQHVLFNIGGELAMPDYKGVTATHLHWIENSIDQLNADLAPLKDFILPAGSVLVSQTHIARTVCRRAERQSIRLQQHQTNAISTDAKKFLNRLSDWLFVVSRYCAKVEQSAEVLWDKNILANLKN